MVNSGDNYFLTQENDVFEVSFLSTIGDRNEQQDCSGYVINKDNGLVVVCDGMGGHSGGKRASNTAVRLLLEQYNEYDFLSNVKDNFIDSVNDIDQIIASFADVNGNPMRGGTTMVAICICEHDLHWVSVGDSRIYIARKGEMIQVTKDHTYELALKENMNAGLITEKFYKEEIKKSEALISFLGVGGLPIVDSNDRAFKLMQGDRILLMSDGLYKNVDDEIINEMVSKCSDTADAVYALERLIEVSEFIRDIDRDNMTVAIVEIK